MMRVIYDALKRSNPRLASIVQTLRRVHLRRNFTQMSREEKARVFGDVYRNNFWGSDASRSGNGSDITQTAELRAALPRLMQEIGVRTMLDVPCGDFFWMNRCRVDLELYIGADIVPELIEYLNATYATPLKQFLVLELVMDPLPQVDLIFCRDALVHFSNIDIFSAVSNMKRSGARYLLTTTFTGRSENVDIPTGGNWRPLNLERPPFSFPPPRRLIVERCTEGAGRFQDKSMGLWLLSEL